MNFLINTRWMFRHWPGEGMTGTNEDVFINIFAGRSFNHLNAVYTAYASQYGKTMETVIRSEFSGDMANLLLDISELIQAASHVNLDSNDDINGDLIELVFWTNLPVQYSKNKVTYLAQRLHYTMDGAETLDHSLMRLIIGRCEIDLGDVKVEYQRLYGRTLASDVSVW